VILFGPYNSEPDVLEERKQSKEVVRANDTRIWESSQWYCVGTGGRVNCSKCKAFWLWSRAWRKAERTLTPQSADDRRPTPTQAAVQTPVNFSISTNTDIPCLPEHPQISRLTLSLIVPISKRCMWF
jgi:hypothetical protein